MHEIGHALGLTHPHDCCPYLQPKEYDSTQYTAMSYDNIFFNSKILFPTTPMGLDILAVQHIYGPNLNYNNKDNIYYIDGTRKMFTLWDAGGNDTIYVKSYDGHAQVDIREGKVSIIGETIFFIAPNTSIENITLERTNEEGIIFGNNLANFITISLHQDKIEIIPGKGNDICKGSLGPTYYYITKESGHDIIKNFNINTDKIVFCRSDIIAHLNRENFLSTIYSPLSDSVILKISDEDSITLHLEPFHQKLNPSNLVLTDFEDAGYEYYCT